MYFQSRGKLGPELRPFLSRMARWRNVVGEEEGGEKRVLGPATRQRNERATRTNRPLLRPRHEKPAITSPLVIERKCLKVLLGSRKRLGYRHRYLPTFPTFFLFSLSLSLFFSLSLLVLFLFSLWLLVRGSFGTLLRRAISSFQLLCLALVGSVETTGVCAFAGNLRMRVT